MRGPSPTDPQQRDNLCGPFHAARLLAEAGITEFEGEALDQDLVALHAGTALPRVEVGPQVPPGAVNLRDYRFELPRVEQARSGTRLHALVAAIEKLSGGRLACVPLACVPLHGRWTAETVERLLDGAGETGARLIANVRTGHLWGSRPPLEAVLAVLDGEEVADPPPADWDVGHFVELMQLLRGRRGGVVLVRDSYPSLGWSGVYLQPPGAVAGALNRGDGRDGGVLAVAPSDRSAELEQLAADLGIEVKMWDNRS
ncbi:MAG TPA: hypothetical protein VGI50_06590 [Solirubrobacteraceae bacterium]|jgi:hypothetical protein